MRRVLSSAIQDRSFRASALRRAKSLLAAAAVALAPATGALAFSDLIVFGDSLVDQGNTQTLALLGGFGDPTPAAFGYFGGRFTNGINPADVMNQAIEGTNSAGSIFGGDNFAFGGARARNDGDSLPDLVAQTGLYLNRLGAGTIASDTLIMINIGGNDVRDIALGGLAGAARQAVIDDAVTAISTSISLLQSKGALNFLFVGVGNVGGIPELGLLGAPVAAAGRQASIDMNAAIQAALPSTAFFFDTVAWSDSLLANPALFGLPAGIDTSIGCLFAGASPPGGAPTCNDYAFFDNVHPTTQVLQLLGNQLVAVVPEPGTAVLLMFGLAGLAAQRPRAGV